MRWVISSTFIIVWALWAGGMVATMLFAQWLFHGDRSLAALVAPRLFVAFGRYQLVLAATAVLALGAAGRRYPANLKVLVVFAAVTAALSALAVTPRMEYLRSSDGQDSGAFRELHCLSMVIYLMDVGTLLASGIIIARPAVPSHIEARI